MYYGILCVYGEIMNIIIDGLNIEYTEEGSGIPVLLLHGWGCTHSIFDAVLPELGFLL